LCVGVRACVCVCACVGVRGGARGGDTPGMLEMRGTVWVKRIVRADVPMRAYVVHVRACALSCAYGDGEHMRGTGLKRKPRNGARNSVAS
jgi:hypothetical protein